jgi:hypothetical protein
MRSLVVAAALVLFAQEFTPDAVRTAVTDIAAVVEREYLDVEVGTRVAASLRRGVAERRYEKVASREALAALVTGDLLRESQDKHLAVTVVPEAVAPGPPAGQGGRK